MGTTRCRWGIRRYAMKPLFRLQCKKMTQLQAGLRLLQAISRKKKAFMLVKRTLRQAHRGVELTLSEATTCSNAVARWPGRGVAPALGRRRAVDNRQTRQEQRDLRHAANDLKRRAGGAWARPRDEASPS